MASADRVIGFSTGSLCGSDFRAALETLRHSDASAVELSALRESEFRPLLDALPALALDRYRYVSIHAPSALDKYSERDVVRMLRKSTPRECPVIVHADIIRNVDTWKELGPQLCIENMDKRKRTGRTVGEMRGIFAALRKASLCLDLAHARQVDPSLSETVAFLLEFRDRLGQLHVSELNSASKHEALSFSGVAAVQAVRDLIPDETPVILEFSAEPHELGAHLRLAGDMLRRSAPVLRWQVG